MNRCTEGRFSRDRIPVLSHAMDIPVRLKEVNRDFFVMFNTRTQRYEIHCASQLGDTMACSLPFDELDARAIRYAREFSAARTKQIAEEIERYNEKLEKDRYDAMLDKANYKCREAFNYLKNNSKTDEIPEEVLRE